MTPTMLLSRFKNLRAVYVHVQGRFDREWCRCRAQRPGKSGIYINVK